MPGRGEGDGEEVNDMLCYNGGLAVEHNFQMCDVTSEPSAALLLWHQRSITYGKATNLL
jgi:hypothetical protein